MHESEEPALISSPFFFFLRENRAPLYQGAQDVSLGQAVTKNFLYGCTEGAAETRKITWVAA